MSEKEYEVWTESPEEVKHKLVELYLNVKVRSKDEISEFTEDLLKEERDKLLDSSISALINYIKTSIEILMNLKVEDYLELKQKEERELEELKNKLRSSSSASFEPPKDYEEVIQKYEGDIRKHIRIEQQMKLHSDALQQKIEDKEKEFAKIETKILQLNEEHQREKKLLNQIIENKDQEIKKAKKAINFQSKEIMDLENQMPLPSTAKSYMEKRNS